MNKSDVALCNCMHEHTNSTAKCTHMHIWCLGACSIWAAEVEGAMGLLHAIHTATFLYVRGYDNQMPCFKYHYIDISIVLLKSGASEKGTLSRGT